MNDSPANSNGEITVRLDSLDALVAAVPDLVGFCPHDSLVLVTHRGGHPVRLGMTMRLDLADLEGDAQVAAVSDQIVGNFRMNGVAGAWLVLTGTAPWDPNASFDGWAELGVGPFRTHPWPRR